MNENVKSHLDDIAGIDIWEEPGEPRINHLGESGVRDQGGKVRRRERAGIRFEEEEGD